MLFSREENFKTVYWRVNWNKGAHSHAILSEDEIAKFLTITERKKIKNIRKTYCSMDIIYFFEYLQELT